MYRVLICDDSSEQLTAIAQMVESVTQEMGILAKPECFSAPPPLYDALRKYKEDHCLVLMDILLGEQNGIDVTARIHKENEDISVILMSTSTDYILSGYDVRALQYLVKPVEPEKLKSAIRFDHKSSYQSNRFWVYQRNDVCSIKLADIIYVECVKEVTELHTTRGIVPTTELYRDVVARLPEGKFGSCRRNICIHYGHIREISANYVVLDDGETLPMSRSYVKALRAGFMTFLHNALS